MLYAIGQIQRYQKGSGGSWADAKLRTVVVPVLNGRLCRAVSDVKLEATGRSVRG